MTNTFRPLASRRRLRAIALPVVLIASMYGCKTAPATIDDSTLTANVQGRIATDAALTSEPIQAIAQAGIITLTGAASNAAARSLAARDAASVAGVTKVMNDITVNASTAPVSATASAPLPVPRLEAVPRPSARIEAPLPTKRTVANAAPITRTSAPPPSAPPPAQPAAPLPPIARTVTLSAGSTLPVRVTQTLDSATTQPGDSFSGAVATDIVVDGMVMIPRGATVSGRVTEVHEAAHFKGSSLLTVELTGLNSRGERISLSTQPYSVQGKGRGENTAVKTGVGAAAGAILGGIFGGGKGAAIGAAAGGGTGAGINAVTRGQQVQIASETIVRFITTNSIATRTSVHVGNNAGDPSLTNR